jgi:hypothetical protein
MRTAISAILTALIVLAVGSIADFYDVYSRTAYALGVVTGVAVFLVASRLEKR